MTRRAGGGVVVKKGAGIGLTIDRETPGLIDPFQGEVERGEAAVAECQGPGKIGVSVDHCSLRSTGNHRFRAAA